jgi:hypothetical protein
MAHGVIESIYMSAIVEGVLYLELPHIYMLFFPKPFIIHLSSLLYHIYKSPFIRFQALALLFGTGVRTERVDLKFGLDFVIPLLISFISLFSIIFLFF